MDTATTKSAFRTATYEDILEAYQKATELSKQHAADDSDLAKFLANSRDKLLFVSQDVFDAIVKEPGAIVSEDKLQVAVKNVCFLLNKYLPACTLVGVTPDAFPFANRPLVSEMDRPPAMTPMHPAFLIRPCEDSETPNPEKDNAIVPNENQTD